MSQIELTGTVVKLDDFSGSAVPGGIGIDHDSNQRICSTVRVLIRKGQLSLIFIKGLCALCISTEVKRLVLLASDTAIRSVRSPNQVFDLSQRHADLQLGEFAVRSGYTKDFPHD